MRSSNVRKASVAGLFYPAAKNELILKIKGFLEEDSPPALRDEVLGVIVPHAGYDYSGRIAAEIYRLSEIQNIESCIILGPNHQGRGGMGIAIFAKGGFETPLGTLFVDEALAGAILNRNHQSVFSKEAHEGEHSIEVQIPFLQMLNSSLKIVPIVMSDYRYETCRQLALAIQEARAEFSNKKILIMASTDFSHYHTYEQAVEMDNLAVHLIEEIDTAGLFESAEAGAVELCGLGPALVLMMVLQKMGAIQVHTLRYANSGDVTGDRTNVVGYVAMVFSRKRGGSL